jgi:hypothetical protein
VDAFEPAILALLAEFPQMPASGISQRVGWTFSASVLRARVAVLRPLYAPADPADRTTYVLTSAVRRHFGGSRVAFVQVGGLSDGRNPENL